MTHSYKIRGHIIETDAEHGPFSVKKSEYHPGHESGLKSCCTDAWFIVWDGPGIGFNAATQKQAERIAYCMNEAFLLGQAMARLPE